MAHPIEVDGLIKSFGHFNALDGLDLTVHQGEVHGFLGPNGSGKSTTIRILLGLQKATGGTATLFGSDPWADSVSLHRRLAYVPGEVALWPNLTGGEIIDFLGRLQGSTLNAKRDELCERFHLDATKKTRTYSKGNRQKVALVAALASDAELLLLDEPTSGLDPLMEAEFQDVILDVARQGRTVLLSSHILAQVEKLASRVTIIRQGKTVESGSLDEMRHLRRTSIVARTQRPVPSGSTPPGAEDLHITADEISFSVDSRHLDASIGFLSTYGLESLVSHPPTLEELFLRHYGDELADIEQPNRKPQL